MFEAGFGKIHLDASMPCSGDPAILPDEIIAARAARLAKIAETAHQDGPRPLYIIGTEVPVPGGASHGHALAVTAPAGRLPNTCGAQTSFRGCRNLADAWSRVVGLVVQPGVEFDNVSVIDYDPVKARALVRWRQENADGIVFEAHSTDFQRPDAYKALVEDGFAILKVGPGVTFAMREAICALAEIEKLTIAPEAQSRVLETAHAVMRTIPAPGAITIRGTQAEQDVLLFNSYSDRIRYYWPDSKIEAAVAKLVANLKRGEAAGNSPEPVSAVAISACPRRSAGARSGSLDPGQDPGCAAPLRGRVPRLTQVRLLPAAVRN